MTQNSINVVVMNVSLFEGMAGSMRVKNLVEPIYEKGHISLSNLALTHTYEKDKINKEGVMPNGVSYRYIGYNSALSIAEITKFYRNGLAYLKNQFQKDSKNVIYHYGYPDVKNIYLVIRARMMGYKVIFDIVEDNRYIKKYSGLLGWARMKSSILLLSRIKNFTDSIIVISDHLDKRVRSVTHNAIPVFLIPITVNLKYFPKNNWELNSSSAKIFYGGSFFLSKDGIENLIKAFKSRSEKYPGLQLILSGKSVSSDEMSIVLEMIKDNPKIKYLGYLTSEQYFEELNSCDIFCMPRNNSQMAHAGFPFKLGEFLATGRAVISTNVGDVPKYLKHLDNAYLVKPDSCEELEAAIDYCLTKPEHLIKMGNNARKTAEANFSSETLSTQLLNILRNI